MSKIRRIIFLCAAALILVAALIAGISKYRYDHRVVKVGFLYIGDTGAAYTMNFVDAMYDVARTYKQRVQVIPEYNVAEGDEAGAFDRLIQAGCEIIFSTSYGFGGTAKNYAMQYPDIQFCQATCDNANEEPVLGNFHNFMGEIYQGRYICGVAAGMKLKELIDAGRIAPKDAKLGYVAAYPYAEVISGYTAFFLGARSVVPEAVMEVIYTDSWGNYRLEKEMAERLIDDGCVIISQHSDTKGAAVACESAGDGAVVYHVGYNQSMTDVAPDTSITGCRINWNPYIVSAVGAILEGKKIEDAVDANINGNDAWASFDRGWVEMVEINEKAAAKGTAAMVEELIGQFSAGSIEVFKGDYTGVDPFDGDDICDLNKGYDENSEASAPRFHYVLEGVITVVPTEE